MVKFSWDILDMRNTGGVVTQVWFKVTASEAGRAQSLQGSVSLPEPDKGVELTDYRKLTEKQVINWVSHHPAADGFRQRVADALKEPEAEEEQSLAPLPWAAD